jgi:putative oxidoreductase
MTATQAHRITLLERADALRDQPATRDLGLLAVRVALAWIFIYHGAETLFGAFHGAGLHTTSLFYANVAQLRPGSFFAVLGGSIEFFGGIAIGVGLLTRLAALALFGDMVMAMITVTFKNGVATNAATLSVGGGYEINVALAGLAAALVLLGAGRFSFDALVGPRLRAKLTTRPRQTGSLP